MEGAGDLYRIGSSDDTLDSFKKVSKKRSLYINSKEFCLILT